MAKCLNPECGKELPEGKNYCGEECLKKAVALRRHSKRNNSETTDSSIETVLKYMGIDKANFTKNVAYRHWELFIRFVRDNSGRSWDGFIRPRLRSFIGINYRYLEEFVECCLAWETVTLEDGNLVFIGVPNGEKKA
jgi:hypothetical protein